MIDCVVMNQGAAPAAFRAETFRQHADHVAEFLARQMPIRPGRVDEVEQFIFVPIFRRRRGDDLLGEHIERLFRNDQTIQFAALDRTQQGDAFDQFIPG